MSKKGSTSTTNISKQALPYLQQASNAATGTYQSNAGNVSNITGLLNQNIPTVLGQTLNNPTLAAASGYDQDVLGGKYLTGNPFLQQQIDATNQDVTNGVNTGIGTRGLTGGSAQAQLLARELAKNETNLRYTDYTNERNNMNTAAGNAATVAGAQNQGIGSLLAYLTGTAELPGTVANQYADTLGGLWGNKTSTTQTPSTASSVQSGIGTALSIASLFSDRRLKTDIIKIGEESDGLGIYRYRYKAGGPERTGVMADEVARIRPWALGPLIEGVATVNYGAL